MMHQCYDISVIVSVIFLHFNSPVMHLQNFKRVRMGVQSSPCSLTNSESSLT